MCVRSQGPYCPNRSGAGGQEAANQKSGTPDSGSGQTQTDKPGENTVEDLVCLFDDLDGK